LDVPFGSNWRERRSRAKERAGDKCERCGVSQEELLEKGRQGLNVHQTVSRRFVFFHPFMTLEDDANNPQNLEVLCRSCHNVVEQEQHGNFRWSD
jgi:5-methylcytosine-specific restriction endonuclease McrA